MENKRGLSAACAANGSNSLRVRRFWKNVNLFRCARNKPATPGGPEPLKTGWNGIDPKGKSSCSGESGPQSRGTARGLESVTARAQRDREDVPAIVSKPICGSGLHDSVY